MNTPGHLILGAALAAKPARLTILCCAIFGAILPDLSLVVLVFWASSVQGIAESIIFSELYYSADWQRIFSVDNSIPIWSLIYIVALFGGWVHIKAFALAGLAHVTLDFALHNDDARSQFWPLTSWKFESPISYWDGNHFGQPVSLILFVISLIAFIAVWRRFTQSGVRAVFLLLLLLDAWVGLSWWLYF